MSINFSGVLGTEWTLTVVDSEDGSLILSNFDFGAGVVGLPGPGTDIIVGNGEFGTSATINNNTYQNFSQTPVEINSLEVLSGATVNANASQMTLNGSLVNSGTFNINSDQVTILGGIVNDHLMTIDAENGGTSYLRMDSGVFTIEDGLDPDASGDLRLTNGTDGQAFLTGRNGELTILENESRISGNGLIGWSAQQYFPGGYVSIKNSGVIDANSSGRTLIINQGTTEANPLENEAFLVANGNGRLILEQAFIEQGIDGTIGAYDAGSQVLIADSVVRGGFLETADGGIIYLETGGAYGGSGSYSGAMLDGSTEDFGAVTITTDSLVRIGEPNVGGRSAIFQGAIVNQGEIGIHGYQSSFFISTEGATFTGGGEIELSYPDGSNYGGAFIHGRSDSENAVLTNVDNHIHGAGTIGRYDYAGYGQMLEVINGADGIIEADVSTNVLAIARTTAFENEGILRASGGATLEIGINDTSRITVITNTGGDFMATGADSLVVLRAATIFGGTLDSADDGEIQLLNGTASFLDGSGDAGAVGNDGTVRLQNGMIAGEFANRDTLTFFTSGTAQFLVSTVGVTLTGGGNVTMLGTAGAASRIIGENGTDTSHLVNEDNTIQGGGFIGSSPSGFETNLLTLENGTNGTIRATVLETLIINTSGAIENDGTLSASGGTLDIRDDITGTGALAASFGGTLLLRGDWTGDVAFSGATAETLGHTASSSWVSGSVVTLSGMGTGDKVDLGFTSTLDIDSPNVFDWSQDGNDGTLDYFAIGGGTRSFVFEGLTKTHFSLENNGNSGVALVRQSTIDGTDAANTLNGTTGDDRMVGFGGNDTFKGAAGDDILGGTDGNDTADYSGATGGVTVDLAINDDWQTVGGGQGDDMFRSVENVTGSRFGDDLTGCARVNRIDGGAGNDRITGSGDDSLLGGAGNDTFILDIRGDRISDASGTDHVRAGFSFTLAAAFENLTLTGSGAFNGTGNALRNILAGNTGNNTLSGLGGNDTLNGSGGNDLLIGGVGADAQTGGGGADKFQFKTKADSTVAVGGRDTILDFVRSQGDRVDLTALDANLRKAGNQAFDFIGASAFGGEAGELRFSKGPGSTLVQADLNGDRKADFAFAFDDPLALIARDFLL